MKVTVDEIEAKLAQCKSKLQTATDPRSGLAMLQARLIYHLECIVQVQREEQYIHRCVCEKDDLEKQRLRLVTMLQVALSNPGMTLHDVETSVEYLLRVFDTILKRG